MDLKELESGVDPNIHWYYQSKKIPFELFVKKIFLLEQRKITLIDFGAGSGFFTISLFKKHPEWIDKVLLVDTGYSQEEMEVTKGKDIVKQHLLPDVLENSIVVMMDVLEHIEGDLDIVKNMQDRSKGANYFFITVPAFMSLWSGHDKYLGHYRRYTRKTLALLLRNARFGTRRVYYIFGFIYPLVWMVRRMKKNPGDQHSDMKPVSPFVNALLKMLCSFEMNFRYWNTKGGVTVTAEGKI